MKNKNLRKFLSAAAVLAISATSAISVMSVAGCFNGVPLNEGNNCEKLITADENHTPHYISTATGVVETRSSGRKYFVAPDGDINNDGLTWETAMSIADLLATPDLLQPGDTVYVKPGTYTITSMVTVPESTKGEYNKYIRVVNAAFEKSESGYTGNETLATLDFSRQYFGSAARGVQIYGSYIYWYGIDVCGAGDNGLYIGGSYNTVEYCEFYNNRDTGLQLGRIESSHNSIDRWPSYNLIKNCTSHNNYDNETYGENADGFAAKLTVGYGNVFDGCIAYRNSDDGWDLYAKSDSGNIGCVIIYNCVAFENGYLEYPQQVCNSKFENYNSSFNEANTNSFKTRDGDGNGFKLGGSVMEGDVVMYNCLSFHNRMHGVTDNSNPGYLKVEGVTSYDNSAAVDDNSESGTFGQIIRAENHDTHSNVDVARQTYSYNSVINTLSIGSGVAVSLDSDAYRGSVTNSVLYGKPAANFVLGSLDADTKIGKDTYTEQKYQIAAADVFKTLPIVYEGETPTYNITGLYDLYANGATSGALNPRRVHLEYRNPDMSINMGDILAKKDGVDNSLLISGQEIGSTLNKTSWDGATGYKHFYATDLADSSKANQNEANIQRAYEALTINTDQNAVYQDFEVPVKLRDCTISWTSEDSTIAEVGTVKEVSTSTSEYIKILVYRPLNNDVQVKLTATIKSNADENLTVNKEFTLNVKAGTPTIGAIKVVTPKGQVIADGGSYVVDQYAVFNEPEVQVENGIDYNGKLLKNDQYTYTTTYRYATDKNSNSVQIKGFTPSNAGVYTVTKTVTLKSDGSQKTMTYTIYVSSQTAQVDFVNGLSSVSVNRDGFMISGNLSNATGIIYAVSSPTPLYEKPAEEGGEPVVQAEGLPTVEEFDIKSQPGVESYSFRNDSISFQFTNGNNSAYYVYYALANLNGEITSEVYDAKIDVVDITSTDEFMTLASGTELTEEKENPQTTIYMLANDLDFSGVSYTSGIKDFVGVLNGNGHIVKNVSLFGVGMFRVRGGTIENIKFDNIKISNDAQKTGIVSTCYGGYFHNIAITNLLVTSSNERTGGLIGQVYEGTIPTSISQVSIVNPIDAGTEYYIEGDNSQRTGGLIGLIQASGSASNPCLINISDCYVMSDVKGLQQVGGMVGAFDNAKANLKYDLKIERCYFNGAASSTYATPRVGGIIGYQSGNVGIFTITGCVSVGRLFNQGHEITVALKTASLIVGGFSSAAINVVNNCIATMQEYNSDYQVDPYSERNLQSGIAAIEEILGDDNLDKWSFVYADGGTTSLQAPYLTLNFLDV